MSYHGDMRICGCITHGDGVDPCHGACDSALAHKSFCAWQGCVPGRPPEPPPAAKIGGKCSTLSRPPATSAAVPQLGRRQRRCWLRPSSLRTCPAQRAPVAGCPTRSQRARASGCSHCAVNSRVFSRRDSLAQAGPECPSGVRVMVPAIHHVGRIASQNPLLEPWYQRSNDRHKMPAPATAVRQHRRGPSQAGRGEGRAVQVAAPEAAVAPRGGREPIDHAVRPPNAPRAAEAPGSGRRVRSRTRRLTPGQLAWLAGDRQHIAAR